MEEDLKKSEITEKIKRFDALEAQMAEMQALI